MKKHLRTTTIASMILYDYYSFNDSGKHLGNFCEYGSCNRIIEAEIKLKEIKNRSPDKWILGHLNNYSSKNKFDSLKNTLCKNMDILLISETKLDDSFPSAMGSVLRFDDAFRWCI